MNEEETAPQQPDPIGDWTGSSTPALASEVSRRVGAILDSVEREAARLREEAQADAARYLADARRGADQLVFDRQRRIAELSDDLVAKSEAVVSRLDDAAPVRAGFEHLVRALAAAAERLSHEIESGAPGSEPPVYAEAAPPADPAPRSP
jgi:hypothetical protein